MYPLFGLPIHFLLILHFHRMEKDSPICEEIIEVSSGIHLLNLSFLLEITTFQEQSGYQKRTPGNQLQIRKEVEKVLKPYNTTSYSLLVCNIVSTECTGIWSGEHAIF